MKDSLNQEIKLGEYAMSTRHGASGIITKITAKGANLGVYSYDGKTTAGQNYNGGELLVITQQYIHAYSQEQFDKELAKCQPVIDANAKITATKKVNPVYRVSIAKVGDDDYKILVLGFPERNSSARCQGWLDSGISFPRGNSIVPFSRYGGEQYNYSRFRDKTIPNKFYGHRFSTSNYGRDSSSWISMRNLKRLGLPAVKPNEFQIIPINGAGLVKMFNDKLIAVNDARELADLVLPKVSSFLSDTELKQLTQLKGVVKLAPQYENNQ